MLFVLLLLLTLAIFAINIAIGGSISGPRHLARELKSPATSPQDWRLDRDLPARHRLLFKWLVRGSWRALVPRSGPRGFYLVYLVSSFFAFYGTFVAFYFFLRMLGFGRAASFMGCVFLIASPPVLLAYRFPVHTREDPLAYLLVVCGLMAVFSSRRLMMCTIAAVGALTRETTLIVPLVYLISSGDSWRKKALFTAPAASIVLLLWSVPGAYYLPNPARSRTVHFPIETIFFLFMVFGALWLPALLKLGELRREKERPAGPWGILSSTAPIALLLIVGIHLAFARAREIRISFLAFPWIIPPALDWFRLRVPDLRELAGRTSYRVFAILASALLTGATAYVRLHCHRFMWHLRAFQGKAWLNLCYGHLLITLLIVLPLAMKRVPSNRPPAPVGPP